MTVAALALSFITSVEADRTKLPIGREWAMTRHAGAVLRGIAGKWVVPIGQIFKYNGIFYFNYFKRTL